MVFTNRELTKFFHSRATTNGHSGNMTPGSLESISGVLIFDGTKCEKIQVYRSAIEGGRFKVLNGWYERGYYDPYDNKFIPDKMCAIGPGYPIESLNIRLDSGLYRSVHIVETFEPDVFGKKQLHEREDA